MVIIPTVKDPDGSNQEADKIPEICPHCQSSISVKHIISKHIKIESIFYLQVVYSCPNQKCKEIIVATYEYNSGQYYLQKIEPQKFVVSNFQKEISDLSPQFVKIYNEAYNAETFGLLEICGPGYRKALEFLIKDYLIENNPDNENDIKTKMLSPCINTYISDVNIKFCAERAAWVGNDETHYVRRWDNKDLQDLKMLIQLTVNWIMNEIFTEKFRSEMP